MASKSAAKQEDRITATDTHIVTDSTGIPQSLPHQFNGALRENLSDNVFVMGKRAATKGSIAHNDPPHTPTAPGVAFQNPPRNRGTVLVGSRTVFVNGKPAARGGDSAETCADPNPNQQGKVIVNDSTVFFGE